MNAARALAPTMDDPVSLVLLWGSAGAIVVGLLVAIAVVLVKGKPEQVEPEAGPVPAHEQCAVADCPREWQSGRAGVQLCHTHYRELVTHRSAS